MPHLFLEIPFTQSQLSISLRQVNNELMLNNFFKHALADTDIDTSNDDINSAICLMNNSIYNYFKENYGTVKGQVDKEPAQKYKAYSTHSLQKALKRLKLAAPAQNKI